MAGGHHHKTYTGPIPVHAPPRLYRYSSIVLGASMWFWIFYRLKNDGPVLFGYRHPWEGHHGSSHDEHKKEDGSHH
ncbi:hypothetical protein V1514DRAFT_329957 [Lipomyces japonicus]|uniref:uncharacterized protein n=1 Tax=Lipomyces japonicus TaxID=56871 RepID=UPI0034CD5CBB